MLSGVSTTYSSFFFVSVQELGRARRRPRRKLRRDQEAHGRMRSPRSRRASPSSFPRPRFPAWGHRADSPLCSRTAPAGTAIPGQKRDKLSWLQPRKRPELAGVMTHGAVRSSAGRRRCGQGKGAHPAGRPVKRVPDAADLHGRRAGELLQPFRPAVAGLRAGGRLPTEPTPQNLGKFYVDNGAGEMVPLSTLTDVQNDAVVRSSS